MSRPWHKGTPCPHLSPDILGQFDTFQDWINHARRALTGYENSMGYPVSPVCIDALGRRCSIGNEFERARDEGTFPIRYFVDCKLIEITTVEVVLNANQS